MLLNVFSVAVHAHVLLISWEAAFCDRTTGSSALEEGGSRPVEFLSGGHQSKKHPEFV